MTRRFQKSVGPSVCPFVTLTKKPTPSLLTVEKQFAYQVKGFGILYKKMRRYFQKIFFKNFRANFRKKLHLHKMPTPPSL